MKTVWVASEQRADAEWYIVKVFLDEIAAKLWMYEASNRGVEECEFVC